MNEFRFRYDELIKLVGIYKEIDLINKWWSNATTVRASNAEKLFRKGLLSGISFIKLIPKDDETNGACSPVLFVSEFSETPIL